MRASAMSPALRLAAAAHLIRLLPLTPTGVHVLAVPVKMVELKVGTLQPTSENCMRTTPVAVHTYLMLAEGKRMHVLERYVVTDASVP